MNKREIHLDIDLGQGWSAVKGIINGTGPLGSVLFHHNLESVTVVGIDLDKGVFMMPFEQVSQASRKQIVRIMNEARRELFLEQNKALMNSPVVEDGDEDEPEGNH
jgi:hypothetical protein